MAVRSGDLMARRLIVAVLGLALGAFLGGPTGLLAGLAYTWLAQTSEFEGFAGYVVLYWGLAGLGAGAMLGLILGWRLG